MGASLADLDPRDLVRLRAELVEVIAARFAYPPFFDYRSGTLRVRPVTSARRDEIAKFVQAASFEPVERVEVEAPEIRRFFVALFQTYLQTNRELARPAARYRLPAMRADIAGAAAEVQQGLVAFASGTPGTFGVPRPAVTWNTSSGPAGRAAPKWERIERSTQALQAALLRQSDQSPSRSAGGVGKADAGASEVRPAAPTPWAGVPIDGTSPMPAMRGPGGHSPFAGLETGSQSAMFGNRPNLSPVEQPTSMQPIPALGGVPGAGATRELPPEMQQLYNEYLRDLQPRGISARPPAGRDASSGAGGRAPARGLFGWRSPGAPAREEPSPRETATTPSMPVPPAPENKADVMIFEQLRRQLDDYIWLAARSYGVRVRGADPASALDTLRRSGHVDNADLRVAEGILALADRVAASGGATLEDYRQALMLYLLYHRSRMGG
jgi:hypothetical protein